MCRATPAGTDDGNGACNASSLRPRRYQAALTLGVRGGGILMALLVLPLYIPVLILGSGAVTALERGVAVAPYLLLLGALAVLSIAFAPLAAALALRISLD